MNLTIGQVVSLLAKCASDSDELLMGRHVWAIGVDTDGVHLMFDDNYTPNYFIKTDGTKVYLD